VVLEVGAVF